MSDGAEGKLVVEDNLTNQANITQKEIEITGGDFENVRTSSITAEKITVADGSSLVTDAAGLDISDSITITGESTLLNLKDDGEAEIDATITGAGKIVKEGEGTVTLSGDNTYTGTTTITGGAIEIGSADNISTNTIYMDGGKLIISAEEEVELGNEIIGTDHNDVDIEVTGENAVLTGEILGNENLVKTGEGILDLQMDSNSYAGDTVIGEGGIRGTTENINGKVIGSGDENSSVEFYDEDGEVTLNEFDTEKFIGTFEKTGAATMTVTNNFKAINANITNGTFVINNDASMGGSGSTFEVTDTMKLTDSILKGYGDITTGDLIIGKNASLAPGNSTTTFKVNGNLIFEDNGNYDVEFGQFDMDSEGHYNDNTQVSGTTTIGEDATITLNNLEGKYYVAETIELINSGTLADGYEYKEENVTFNDNDARDLRVGYDTRISTRVYTEGNILKIDLQRKQSEYSVATDFDRSHNEQEAANTIDAVSTGKGGDITLPLDVMEHFYYYEDPETGETNIPALKAALNDVAGVIHANATNLTFFNSKAEHVYDKIKERTSYAPCTKIHDRIWGEYYYNTYNVDKDDNSPKFNTTTNGFLVGFDIISSKKQEEESLNENNEDRELKISYVDGNESNVYFVDGNEAGINEYFVDGNFVSKKYYVRGNEDEPIEYFDGNEMKKNEKYEPVPQVYFVDGNDIKINEKPAEKSKEYYVTGNEESPNEYNIDGTENDSDIQYEAEESSEEGQWILGVMGGYGTNELKQRRDKTSMNDINLGLYGGYENNKWLLKGMLLGGYEQYTIDRTIEFMDRTANSDHNGYSAALDLEAGYKISLNKKDSQARHKMYLKPFVGVIGSYMNNESYEEKGAESLNLKVENYDAVTAEARAGLEINGKIKKFGWYAKAGVRQLLTDKRNEIEMSLLDFADETKMKIWSAENAQTTLTGGIGADYALSEDWTIFANGLGNFADVSTNYYANIGLMYKFGCKHNKEVAKENKVDEIVIVDNKANAEEELRKQLEEKALREAEEREKALREAEEREKALQEQIQNYKAKIVSEQEAQQMKEKTITSLRISGPTFKFGTTELSEEGKGKLKEVAQEIKNYPDADVLIEGHTDSIGSDEVNQKLSEQRASSVATSLKKDYKITNNISVIGKGEKEPIASNETEAGRAKNRRVEIILTTAE
ncbi:MAG: autotransporter domain-containing protein, partial [Elusimicrobia bacterium]|nr:autotransporter domain-containing protein [Elusimicrobiota bacterium]